MSTSNHPFHLVNYRPWPIISALNVISLITGIIIWFHQFNISLLIIALISIIISNYQWWRDVCRERTFQGLHTIKVTINMKYGIILFIVSEIFFFISFFWAFFHRNLSPRIELGAIWPPKSILPFNPFQIPLLNTIILLTSGITVTWTHHRILNNNFTQSIQSLLITLLLGIYFSILQAFEYIEAPFTISDRVYGTTFFIATGFHGLHVIVGTIFLTICFIRLTKNHFSLYHHFGFEAASWYWHFVDIVWLYLYIFIYWWSS